MFSQMPPGVLRSWLKWAWSHDWGEGAYPDDCSRIVIPLAPCFDDDAKAPLRFSRPAELKAWAGY